MNFPTVTTTVLHSAAKAFPTTCRSPTVRYDTCGAVGPFSLPVERDGLQTAVPPDSCRAARILAVLHRVSGLTPGHESKSTIIALLQMVLQAPERAVARAFSPVTSVLA